MRAAAVLGAAAAIVLTVVASARTQAEQSQMRAICADNRTEPNLRISACTVVILKAKEAPGNLAITYYNRGFGYQGTADYDRAIADYSKAIDLNPKFANAYNNRGTVYGIKGDHDRAIADFTKAIDLDPKDANAFNNRCFARAITGQAQAALADCDTALRLKPDYADAFANRALAYYLLARYDEALADYDRALKLDPRAASSLYGRGMIKLKKGDPTGGIDIAAAKALEPDIADKMARDGMK